jgi:hypothetical protein
MGTAAPSKDSAKPTTLQTIQMSRELALSLLRSGNTGDQILQILETITNPEDDNGMTVAEPTLDALEF